MLVRNAFNFISHIVKILAAEPPKRFKYTIYHIIFLGVAFGLAYAIKYIIVGTFTDGNINLLVGILGLIVSIAAIIPFILHGLVGQIVCVVTCLISSFRKDGRVYSILSILLALISLVVVFLITYFFIIK